MTVRDRFDALVETLGAPMFVVTAAAAGEHAGCLVGFAGQTSIDPLRFTVWISDVNHTSEIARRAEILAVHVLREGDDELARHFGERTGDEVDKLAGQAWDPGPGGVPILTRCDWFVGRVVDRIRGASGDHLGHVLEPIEVSCTRGHYEVLSYGQVLDLDPGHPI